MKKSSECFKISFVVGFSTILITSPLFANDHDNNFDEKLQSPRVHVNPSEIKSVEEFPVPHTDSEENVQSPRFHEAPTSMIEVLEMYDEAERAAKGLKSPACPEIEQSHISNRSNESKKNVIRMNVTDDSDDSVDRALFEDTRSTMERLDNLLLTEERLQKMQLLFGNRRGNNGGNKKVADKNNHKKWKNSVEKLRESNSVILKYLEKQGHAIDKARQKKLLDSNLSLYAQNRKLIFDYNVHPDLVQSYNKLDQVYMKLLWQKVAKEIPEKKEKSIGEYETPKEKKASIKDYEAEVKFVKKLLQSDSSFTAEFKRTLEAKIARLQTSMKTDDEIFKIKKQHKDLEDALGVGERKSKPVKNTQSDVKKMTETMYTLRRQINQHNDALNEMKEINTIQTFIEKNK